MAIARARCVAQPAFADGVRSAIERANAEFSAAAAKRDGAGLAALYAADDGSATLQVLENSTDDSRLLEAGDDLDLSATVLAAVGF